MAIGSEGFVQEVQVRLEQTSASDRNLDALGRRQLRKREWSAQLKTMMKELSKTIFPTIGFPPHGKPGWRGA